VNSPGAILLAALAAAARIAPAQPGVVIRSTTRLVQVHVLAEDSQGRPVTDLKREDFQIFDERKEQPLVLFTAEGASPAAAVSGGPGGAGASRDGAGYTAILLDWLNASFADRLRGDDAVRKALRSLRPRQEVALYVLGMEGPSSPYPLRLINDFTDDPAEILRAIEDPLILPNPEMEEPPGKFDARYTGARRTTSIEEQLFDWNNRILDSVRALTQLADRMARLPGRKSLLWLSAGFPMTIDGSVVPGARAAEVLYGAEVNRVLSRLNRGDVTVHTLDTVGLATSGRSFGFTLTEFAERTGGTAFGGRNDLETGVRIALADMHAGYTLGFLAPEGAAPGEHRIQVRTRRARAKLRFRESYTADR